MSKMNAVALAETENNAVAVAQRCRSSPGLCGCNRTEAHPRLTDEVLVKAITSPAQKDIIPHRDDS